MAFAEFVTVLYQFFERPYMLFLFIPFFVFLYFYLSEDFVVSQFQSQLFYQYRKKLRRFLLFTRTILFFCLFVALAGPFIYDSRVMEGDPHVKILVDQSDSFTLFNQEVGPQLRDALSSRVRVDYSPLGIGTTSDLGDAVLSHLRQNDNLLLVTDGHVTSGAALSDIALHARTLNATISAVRLTPEKYDASVRVVGPSKTTADVENTFQVFVEESLAQGVGLPVVTLDEVPVVLQPVSEGVWQFSARFSSGYHRISAQLATADVFSSNNEFYKVVKVVPKPPVALYSVRTSPLVELFSPLYDLTEISSLSDPLDSYAALIVDDIPAAVVAPAVSSLTDFAASGNGLVVFGGPQSYDFADYQDSLFEQLLPVYVAKAGRKPGDINIVVVLDISGSTGALVAGDKAVDVEKALALAVISDIGLMNRVGVVAFNTQAYTVAEMKLLIEQTDLVDKVAALRDLGGTKIDVGMAKAIEMLQSVSGDKNIILISDGKTQGYDETLRSAVAAADAGIRVYTIGVGDRSNDDTLTRMADLGHGAFFKSSDEKERIKLLFGDPDDKDPSGTLQMVIFDEHHFITEDLGDLSARLYGYNTVVPKDAAKLLVTTSMGDPILSVWRFGLGRVASFTTDDGTAYAPEILNRANSRLLTRMLNWAIGDPERKNPTYIDIADAAVGDTITVTVRSPAQPTTPGVTLVKIDEDVYQGFLVAEEVGYHTLAGASYAVTGPLEYRRVGYNEELVSITSAAGGKIFSSDEIDEIEAFIRASSRKVTYERVSYAWPFLIFALLVYLVEIFGRRVVRRSLRS